MTFSYRPVGVCSQKIDLTIDDNIIREVRFTGGCNGNLQGIAALLAGMPVPDAIAKLRGIRCGFKGTSCPDQLSKALEQAVQS